MYWGTNCGLPSTAAETDVERRKVLYQDSNAFFRYALEDTRYSNYRPRSGTSTEGLFRENLVKVGPQCGPSFFELPFALDRS
jgi:hypothetical protein